MSNIRYTHPGYFRVALGLSLTWYTALGVGFTVFHHVASQSRTNDLVSHFIPLLVWGLAYLALGLTMIVAILVKRVPHVVVRLCCGIGLVFTSFWLVTYIVTAAQGRLHLVSVIPAWTTMLFMEWAALNEPEHGPRQYR